MVTNDDERTAFSARLNDALDKNGVVGKGEGRQAAVAKMFGVSQKGARKWLEGEAIPKTSRLPLMAQRLGVSTEWLLTGRDYSAGNTGTIYEQLVAGLDAEARGFIHRLADAVRTGKLSTEDIRVLDGLVRHLSERSEH